MPLSQFLYQLFLAVDANFRLKRKDVSSDEHDPGLNHGYAYVVSETEFKDFLKTFGGLVVAGDEKSSCNNYDAIKSASIRGGRGTAASGVGACLCARHDMKRPLGIGDLQLGERYPNMDYVVILTLTINGPRWVVISYDIACQWSIHFAERCERYGTELDPFEWGHIFTYLVPKFHLPAHILSCQVAFSFNYEPGVGRTEGELPERGWSESNGLAYSTREMGPGSRRDTLDDHFGAANWAKITKLASKRMEPGSTGMGDQGVLNQPIHAVPKCCYVVLTASAVRLRLAEEDAEALKEGRATVVHQTVTPSLFILQGIEIEESQRLLFYERKELGPQSTSLQRSKVVERSAALQRKIDSWVELRNSFMPPTVALRQAADNVSVVSNGPDSIPLFLPSSLCSVYRDYDPKLFRFEQQYRIAQAETALHQLRGLILLRAHMRRSKERYGHGHWYLTRSNSLLNDLDIKNTRTAERYRSAREALVRLSSVTGENTWMNSLKVLERSDIQGLTDEDEGGEGRKQLKWIWTTPGTADDQEESTQSEWCKARARAQRWQEECLLLGEEMRRVLAFWEWEISRWEERAAAAMSSIDLFSEQPTIEAQGKVAYALKQADIRRRLISHSLAKWDGLEAKIQTMVGQDPAKAGACGTVATGPDAVEG
ncbi:hypothetical protein BKA70DRAFT_1233619 [Coprinopsis sp. MPI-PUGE-AT-0042]|nr:hypothetical protein BKA70DRAFT_1233619 [Coprinopsis sp. MPI-PUGE-AT-0042]